MKKFFIILLFIALSFPAWSEEEQAATLLTPEGTFRINKIHVDALDVFDPSIPEYRNWVFGFLNKLHVKTKDSFVQRELLFGEGDIVDADILKETERKLRDHSFLDNITIKQVPVGPGLADVYVRSEDQWTTQVNISAGTSSGYTELDFSVEESNFLGFGKTLAVEYAKDEERDGYNFLYYDPQFFNSRMEFESGYETNSDGWRYTTDLVRPFYSMDTRWAYGMSWDSGIFTKPLYHKGRSVAEIDIEHQTGLFFAARSWGQRYDKRKFGLLFTLDNELFPKPARIILPEAAEENSIQRQLHPFDRESYQYGAMFKLEKQRFVEETYLDNFGKIEDVPVGLQFGSLLAYANKLETNSNYFQLRTVGQYVHQVNDHQYLALEGDFAMRKQTTGEFNNVIFSGAARYYLQLKELRLGKRVAFPHQTLAANLYTVLTKDVDAPFQISLGENEGLRGYTFKSFTGQNSLLFNVEDRIFTPFDYRIFAIGLAGFVDAGYVWSGEEHLQFKDFGLSVGFGLRIGLKKSQSGKVVRVDFAVPLHKETGAFTESDQKGWSISISSGQVFTVLKQVPRLFDLF